MSGQMDLNDWIIHQIEVLLVRGYGYKIKFSKHFTDILIKDKFMISFVTDDLIEFVNGYDVNEDMFKVIVDYVDSFNEAIKEHKKSKGE